MTLERELKALSKRLNDLKRRQAAIQMLCLVQVHDEPCPAEARGGDLVIKIEGQKPLA